ncbi:MAG: hypothetical protein MUF61_03120 [archaeon]|jgi:hypothetical protein|nr:hypothetical protein [archaeon]
MKQGENLRRNLDILGVKKPLLAMIHLAGKGREDLVKRALAEVEIFEKEGVDGIIVENYHGDERDMLRALFNMQQMKTKLLVGVNVLPNEFERAFMYARRYGGRFIQLDQVGGRYLNAPQIDRTRYEIARAKSSDITVLGGVWPKYYHPVPGSSLERDVIEGMGRADALVVTGEGTGKETPTSKIKAFKSVTGMGYPIFVGAGLNMGNAYEQMRVADGAIVGSYLKVDGKTENDVDPAKVRDLVSIFRQVRSLKN